MIVHLFSECISIHYTHDFYCPEIQCLFCSPLRSSVLVFMQLTHSLLFPISGCIASVNKQTPLEDFNNVISSKSVLDIFYNNFGNLCKTAMNLSEAPCFKEIFSACISFLHSLLGVYLGGCTVEVDYEDI